MIPYIECNFEMRTTSYIAKMQLIRNVYFWMRCNRIKEIKEVNEKIHFLFHKESGITLENFKKYIFAEWN